MQIKLFTSYIVLILLIFSLVTPIASFADISPTIEIITLEGVKTFYLNTEILTTKNLIVYGNAQDVLMYSLNMANQQVLRDGQWRYLGFRLDKTPYSNPDFPVDIGGIKDDYASRHYVEKPWYNIYPSTGDPLCKKNEDEFVLKLKPMWSYISSQLPKEMPSYMLEEDSLNNYWSIQSYPLKGEIYGTLREWHWRNGWPWYDDYVLKFHPDNYPDYEITEPVIDKLDIKNGKADPNNSYNLTFGVKQLDMNYFVTHDVAVSVDCNGENIYSADVRNFGYVDGQRFITVPWKPPSGVDRSEIIVRINGGNIPADSAHIISENGRYDNNEKNITVAVMRVDQPPPPPSQPFTPNNLSVVSINIIDSKGTPVKETTVNGSYKINVRYKNDFNEGGFVHIALYMNGSTTPYGGEEYIWIDAKSSIIYTWNWPGSGADTVIMAVINLVPLPHGGVSPGKGCPPGFNFYLFNEKEETYNVPMFEGYGDNYIYSDRIAGKSQVLAGSKGEIWGGYNPVVWVPPTVTWTKLKYDPGAPLPRIKIVDVSEFQKQDDDAEEGQGFMWRPGMDEPVPIEPGYKTSRSLGPGDSRDTQTQIEKKRRKPTRTELARCSWEKIPGEADPWKYGFNYTPLVTLKDGTKERYNLFVEISQDTKDFTGWCYRWEATPGEWKEDKTRVKEVYPLWVHGWESESGRLAGNAQGEYSNSDKYKWTLNGMSDNYQSYLYMSAQNANNYPVKIITNISNEEVSGSLWLEPGKSYYIRTPITFGSLVNAWQYKSFLGIVRTKAYDTPDAPDWLRKGIEQEYGKGLNKNFMSSRTDQWYPTYDSSMVLENMLAPRIDIRQPNANPITYLTDTQINEDPRGAYQRIQVIKGLPAFCEKRSFKLVSDNIYTLETSVEPGVLVVSEVLSPAEFIDKYTTGVEWEQSLEGSTGLCSYSTVTKGYILTSNIFDVNYYYARFSGCGAYVDTLISSQMSGQMFDGKTFPTDALSNIKSRVVMTYSVPLGCAEPN